jgi:NAD(P)-dependent dehydrogenase (short-subunit alcohol dehydrogenase family)
MKKVLVIGAAGSIGRELSSELDKTGYHVIPTVREYNEQTAQYFVTPPYVLKDVTNRAHVKRLANTVGKVDGVIYLVGHCPPEGFSEAIKYPLSELPENTLMNEVAMHMVGPFNVFQCLLDNLNHGGCFIFITSAITRLKGHFPPFLQAYHHAAVISAEDWLVEGMRNDPAVKRGEIMVHRIAPGAVDTSFHHGSKIQPPTMLPTERVVQEIRSALESNTEVDKELLA